MLHCVRNDTPFAVSRKGVQLKVRLTVGKSHLLGVKRYSLNLGLLYSSFNIRNLDELRARNLPMLVSTFQGDLEHVDNVNIFTIIQVINKELISFHNFAA